MAASYSKTETGRPPGEASAAFLLLGLGRLVRERVDAGLRDHALALRHLSALGHLSHQPGLSYSELARRAGVTVQSMQATLGELEARGAVERRTPAGRGRRADLRVTRAGATLLRRGRRVVDDTDDDLLGPLGPERRAVLAELLAQATTAALGRPRPGPGA